MPWYRTGTVSVTNGSKNVTGVGTLFSTVVNPGDAFALVDANGNPTGAWYEVDSVTSNTALVLKQSYAGATGSNKQFVVFNLVGNMTTPSFAQRLAQFFDNFQALSDQPTTTPVANSIPVADSSGKINSGWIPDATTTAKGVVGLATTAEAQAGTDATRAVTPAAALAMLDKFGIRNVPGAVATDLNATEYMDPGIKLTPMSGLINLPDGFPQGRYFVVSHQVLDGNYVSQEIMSASTTVPGYRAYRIAVKPSLVFSGWVVLPSSVAGIPTLAVTSTDDATSATSAPLKTAGGLAVAKDVRIGGVLYSSGLSSQGISLSIPAGGSVTHDIPVLGVGGWRVTVVGYGNGYSGNVACEWIVSGFGCADGFTKALSVSQILNSVVNGTASLTAQAGGVLKLIVTNSSGDPIGTKMIKVHVHEMK